MALADAFGRTVGVSPWTFCGPGGHNPEGESHFTLRIESPAFAGKSRVERQRLVHSALGDLLDERVHALSIKASAPGE